MTAPLWSNGGSEWLKGVGRDADVVMSSRVRLARNFAGFPFPSASRREERRQTMELAHQSLLGAVPSLLWVDLNQSPQLERMALVERHLISKQHAKGAEPRAVAISTPDEWLSVMVNEEDHLRIQVIRSGLALSDAARQIERVDDAVESSATYAFSPALGYLTACPTNVGTGLRVSVMLHLPGLKLTGEIDKVRRAAKSMNLAVRGFYGEGSEAAGDIFQLSNQTTLGKTEEALLEEFERQIVPQVIDYERHARDALLKKRRLMLEDKAHRALGVLRSARLLSADEALEQLSLVRLGAELGVLQGLDQRAIGALVLLSQPAHLQRAAGREMEQAERRVERARIIRERLGGS